LGSETAFSGSVYDKDDFAFVVIEGDFIALLCRLGVRSLGAPLTNLKLWRFSLTVEGLEVIE